MDQSNDDHIAQLKLAVDEDPMSENARLHLLEALLGDPQHYDDPLRIEQIRWFVQHHPRGSICATPFVAVDHESVPVAYAELKAMWLQLVAEAPADVQLARGAAAFIAAESADEGKMLIRTALAHRPDAAELWFDLGRITRDPGEQLAAFEKARDTGEQNSNLLVWIASTAFKAGEFEKARRAADELMLLVDEARSRFGDKLDWPERGSELWRRARECSESNTDASTITNAIGQHAYRKHWAHTVLGLLTCRDDDIESAVFHFRESADVRSDCRLSSYGPSSDLLQQICARGRWQEALDYLNAWEEIWYDPRLQKWIASVKEHRLPENNEDV